MRLSIPLLALTALAFSSCVSAYKTGQTPDDVYFSPAKEEQGPEYVQLQQRDDKYYQGSDYYEDRFLRMRVQNRYRWSVLDDYYFYNTYAYNPYGFYNHNWYSPWNSYYAWNNFYNPYYGGIPYYPGGVIIKNPGRYTVPSRSIAFNPSSYKPNSSLNRPIGSRSINNSYSNPGNSRYNNSNSNRSTLGQSFRKVFSNSGGNEYSSPGRNSNNSTPTRTYTPSSGSSSSSSSSSSSGSSSGGASRPPR
jgi:hypothetical protein